MRRGLDLGVLGAACIVAFLHARTAHADEPRRDAWPITVALTSETLGYYPNAFHPGAEAGTELRYLRDGVYELVQTAHLGLVHHPEVMSGGHIGTALINRAVLPFGPYGEIGVGLGYQLTGTPGVTWAPATDRREGFVAGGNEPRSMLRVELSLAVGFDFDAVHAPGLRVFLRYTETLLTPFAPGLSLPLFVTSQLALGVSIPLAPGVFR